MPEFQGGAFNKVVGELSQGAPFADIGGAFRQGRERLETRQAGEAQKLQSQQENEAASEIVKSQLGFQFAKLADLNPEAATKLAGALKIPTNATDRLKNAAGIIVLSSKLLQADQDPKVVATLLSEQAAQLNSGGVATELLNSTIEGLLSDDPAIVANEVNALGQLAATLSGPGKPLSPEGKLQSDVTSGFVTQEQVDRSNEKTGVASAVSVLLPGGGSRKILPSGDEEVRDSANKIVTGQDAIDVIERSAKVVADKEAATQDLRVETERSIQQVKNAEATSAKAFDSVDKIRANITNLEKVIPLIGQGANTGPISRLFPSVKAATIKLEQLQKRLSLDVVGAVTFGALSKGELDLSKAVAIPLGLEGDALIDWTKSTIAAKRKLATYYEDQVIFLSNGGTQSGFIEKQRAKLKDLLSRSGATEQDITQTMKDNNLTRPEVLRELNLRNP